MTTLGWMAMLVIWGIAALLFRHSMNNRRDGRPWRFDLYFAILNFTIGAAYMVTAFFFTT